MEEPDIASQGHAAGPHEQLGTSVLRLLSTRLPVAFEGSPPSSLLTYETSADGEDEYAALAEFLRPHLDAGDLVLALLDERTSEPLHARLLAVRSAFETTRLVVHTTSLPPLGAALLTRVLAELDAEGVLPPSVLASGAARLEELIVSAAWLRSVTKLQHPAPSLKLHARSYLPGGGYAAILDDDPRVVRHRDPAAPLPLPPLTPPEDWRVVVGTGLGDIAMIESTLSSALAGCEIVRVPNRRASAAWWGTEHVVELACMPRALGRLRQAVLGREGTANCPWCGDVIATDTCPLCGAARTATPVTGGHA